MTINDHIRPSAQTTPQRTAAHAGYMRTPRAKKRDTRDAGRQGRDASGQGGLQGTPKRIFGEKLGRTILNRNTYLRSQSHTETFDHEM